MEETNEQRKTELTITLRPVGDGPPAEIRFRRALKALLRHYGLRATWPTTQQPAAPAKE